MQLSDITRDTIQSPAEVIELERVLSAVGDGQTLPTSWAFRGQSRLFGVLIPSFQRGFGTKHFVATAQGIERNLIESFRLHYSKLPHRTADMPDPEVIGQGFDLRCLSVMQHYGVPTRLLDWTSDFWTAVYFACAGDPGSDAELWLYDRQIFRQQAVSDPFEKSLVRVSSSRDTGSLPERPFLTMEGDKLLLEPGVQLTPRSRGQAGHHTVASNMFVDHADALLELHRQTLTLPGSTVATDGFRRYVISGISKARILKYLADHKQITAATIFPDVEGLGRFLRWSFESLLTEAL